MFEFAEHIAITTLRPNMVLTSISFKQVVLWEERKKEKYQELIEICSGSGLERGWFYTDDVSKLPIDVYSF